jgi:hypothetical protein
LIWRSPRKWGAFFIVVIEGMWKMDMPDEKSGSSPIGDRVKVNTFYFTTAVAASAEINLFMNQSQARFPNQKCFQLFPQVCRAINVYSAPAQNPKTIIKTTQIMDGRIAFSRKTIQQENKLNPTYKSISETIPQGMPTSFDPSPVKFPIVNP